MSAGWLREIIEPFEALIAPKKLCWKEKYGTLRCEWIVGPPPVHELENVGPMETVLEEASKRCCSACGHWHDWHYFSSGQGPTVVTTAPVHGWYLTLCGPCRTLLDAK